MNWLILIIAGLCETGFTFCLGKTKLTVGTEYWLWISGFAVLYVLSAVLLAKATQTIPIGIAYPVWTGIGAVGAVLLGIFVFHEPATFWRVFFLSRSLWAMPCKTIWGTLTSCSNRFLY